MHTQVTSARAHTHTHTHAHANTNSTQPDTLSHRLDRDTLTKPNQTPTTHSNNNLDTVYIVSCGIDVVSRGIGTCNHCILFPSLNVSWVFPFVQFSDRVASGGVVQHVLGRATWAACPKIRTSEWATDFSVKYLVNKNLRFYWSCCFHSALQCF